MSVYARFSIALLLITGAFSMQASEPATTTSENKVDGLIGWLLENDDHLDEIPFADVVAATSGTLVLPVDPLDPVDQAMVTHLQNALNTCLEHITDPGHPIHEVGRVNEISRHVEDNLLDLLNTNPAFVCQIPLNASGEHQRSGYPDLRLEHLESGRVFYVDPKIYKSGSETSSFRTFYFEPKGATNKLLDDASHLIVGIAHAGKVDNLWQLSSWQIVDLYSFKVQLKAEFQASNRDLYQKTAVIGRSGE